jgi:uncharacterized repeat protein (TIGR03803 family)
MTSNVPFFRRAGGQGCDQRSTLCSALILLLSGCGGDGGTGTQPLSATAQTLYSFGATSTDAEQPPGVLIKGSDGNFYGTTEAGGLTGSDAVAIDGNGTVYRVTPTGEETVLYLFAGTPADGALPTAVIQGSDGNFYGTTGVGGPNDAGTVFELTPQGVETVIYSFKAVPDGSFPVALVQANDGNFYGTTSNGGAHNLGSVFKLTPEGVETILYSFSGPPDGANPTGQLIQGSDGNFYGVTFEGGLPIPGTAQPNTFVPDYGGTVFKVTPQGVETILHRFAAGADSEGPSAGLIQGSDGNFYGTTSGGNFDSISTAAAVNTNSGTVYQITPAGAESILHTFSPSGSEGSLPEAQLAEGSDGNFYGTAVSGGADGGGTAFQITPAGAVTVLYSFPLAAMHGAAPDTNLIQGSDGNFYGATEALGAHNEGYFFRLVLSTPLD